MSRTTLIIAIITGQISSNAQIIFNMPGADHTYITGINISTHVCGYAIYPGGSVKGFVLKEADTTLFQYSGANTWFGGINDNGIVIGRYNLSGSSFGYVTLLYDSNNNTYESIFAIDGYENVSPNDISNNGWISGDLKSGNQRKIFTYHPDHGLATNAKLINGTPQPTYGGHSVDEQGNITGYWIDGIQQKGILYSTINSSFSEQSIQYEDPGFPGASILKLQLTGSNLTHTMIYFPQSRTSYMWDSSSGQLGYNKLRVPSATDVHALDINEDGYIAGYVTDESGKSFGFFQAKAQSNFFSPIPNGWSFGNDDNCWIEEDYNSINYNSDPYWQSEYEISIPFPYNTNENIPFLPQTSGSWIEWVRAFGEHQCYQFDPNVSYVSQNPIAFKFWKVMSNPSFRGACGGMCTNALHAITDPNGLGVVYPETNNFFFNYSAYEGSQSQNRNILIPIARISQFKQNCLSSVENRKRGHFSGLNQIPEIYQQICSTTPSTYLLSLKIFTSAQNSSGHAVIPYKIERDPDFINFYRIYIYDPNYPGEMDKYLKMTYEDDVSFLEYEPSNGGFETIVRLEDVQPEMVQYPEMYHYSGNRDGESEIAFLYDPDFEIINSSDDSISVSDDNSVNNIENSFDLTTATGYYNKPKYFSLPLDEYRIHATSTHDNPFSVVFSNSNGLINYTRNDALIGDHDYVMIESNNFTYVNNSENARQISAEILIAESELITLTYDISQIHLQPDQRISLQIIDPTHVMITSTGNSTNYNLKIRIFNPEVGFWEASAEDIPIGTNVTQILIPSLTDDTVDGIIVETDADQDGVFETSDAYENTGIPNMLLSHYEVTVPNGGAEETVHVSNVGGGNLNWTVISSPTWITINTGTFGVNHGPITFTVAENTTSEGRQDYILIEAAVPSNDVDTVLVIQGEGGEVGINKLKLEDALITLSPNPAHDFLQITMDTKFLGDASYRIYNAAGQLVQENILLSNRTTLNTSKLESGVYQLQFKISGQQIIKRLVIE